MAGRRVRVPALMVAAVLAGSAGSTAEPIAVEITNRSEPVLCAEKDNVTLALASPAVRRFRIEAAHPAYISTLQRDSFEADWTSCDMSKDPVFASGRTVTTRTTLYEEPALWVVGWTFPTYWRPATAKVRIGDKVFTGLHMLQVWTIRPMGGEEVLVVYPQDGYWRIRPKAPTGMAPTAFGSSFLVGPVEDLGRPVVRFDELAFDAKARAFDVTFSAGGRGRLVLSEMSEQRTVVGVSLSEPVAARPFAMIRSMYITEFNNDVAKVAVREAGAAGWREAPVMSFDKARATSLWAGRTAPSRHNTSSPDMVVTGFESEPAR